MNRSLPAGHPRLKWLEGGPVTSYEEGEITPLIGIITPNLPFISAIYRGPTRGPSYSIFHWNIWICTSWTLPFVPFFWRVSKSLHFFAVSIPLSLWATCGLGFLVCVFVVLTWTLIWMVLSNIFYFHPENLGKWSNLTCAYFSKGFGSTTN